MSRLASCIAAALAFGASLAAIVAVAGPTVSAATPATPAVPAGYRMVSDDTGLITVAVPDDWHVVTAPQVGVDGTMWPRLQAGAGAPEITEWGTAVFAAPVLSVDAEPFFAVEVPESPGCVGQQVVALVGREPFVGYVEYDSSRELPASRGDAGEHTTECDGVFEQLVAGHEASDVTLRMVLWAWGAGDPPLTTAAHEQAMAHFDVAVATLAAPPTTYGEAVAAYHATTGVTPAPPAFVGEDLLEVWSYPTFRDVPQLGAEPVRGSGCGGDGSIGDIVPNGLWAGYVFPGAAGTIEIDLACVYSGATARQVVSGGATVVDDRDPDFVVINNNARRRTLRDDGGAILWGVDDGTGRCAVSAAWGFPEPGIADALEHPASLAWVRVLDGAVTWLAYDCSTGYTLGG